MQVRSRLQIPGNVWEDFFAALIMYPSCALQIDLTTKEIEESERDAERGNGKAIEVDEATADNRGGGGGTADNGGVENVSYVVTEDEGGHKKD